MSRLRENPTLGGRNGRWGEDRACDYLRACGYEIFERNVNPCVRDGRLEIDIVAYERASDTLVFVEVKQHKSHSPFQSRLRSVDKRKLRNLRLACNAWRRTNGWRTGYRFDVIEIYGEPGGVRPVIDHIEDVALFTPKNQFINWR